MDFGIGRKPSATAEEFRLALSSLLEMLVPMVLIPGLPVQGVPVPVREWDDHEVQLLIQNVEPDGNVYEWEDHEIDNQQRETALAILKYLEYHEYVHHNLTVITPQREYRSLRKTAISTSEAYRRTLKAYAVEVWLNGTSYVGERHMRHYRASNTRRNWDYKTYMRATRLISELRKRSYGIEVPSGLDFIGNEARRRLLNSSI